ncbi:MAG: hypothetical protein GC138_06755 [Gammaproteobacteria bacterium]|nr:hypothetical protein [Gammaproteobacteria bacterium]
MPALPVTSSHDSGLFATSHHAADEGSLRPIGWRQYAYLNLYRLVLATIFIILAYNHVAFLHQVEDGKSFFLSVSVVYLLFGLANIPITYLRVFDPIKLTLLSVFIDIIAITTLMHASGGVRSGLGMLLIISIATGSAAVGGQMARFFAAMATLAIFAEQVFAGLQEPLAPSSFAHAGLLGASFFATAILTHHLARRQRESEVLAAQRGVDLADMAQLTEYIIQRMQTGIIVVDKDFSVRLMNESAHHLLGVPAERPIRSLNQLPEPLTRQLMDWRFNAAESQPFHGSTMSTEVLPRFARLGQSTNSGALIFLEDTAATIQQAQQLKLASLGRLTASIAHEIRNPLAAISHAAQLLDESEDISGGDKRLLEIVQNHAQRVNTIIRNVMQLSRRDPSNPQHFDLRSWLDLYAKELKQGHGLKDSQISIDNLMNELVIRIDPDQLRMILDNLCQNALRHGGNNGEPRISLVTGVSLETQRPYIEVIDNGAGVPEEVAQHLFEPFYTTAPNGTGLGLYLSKELAECNQAHLACLPGEGGGRFRLTFADPRRKQLQ